MFRSFSHQNAKQKTNSKSFHSPVAVPSTDPFELRAPSPWRWCRNGKGPSARSFSWTRALCHCLVAGWATPLKHSSQFGWDGYSQYMEKKTVPNDQPAMQRFITGTFTCWILLGVVLVLLPIWWIHVNATASTELYSNWSPKSPCPLFNFFKCNALMMTS